MQTETDWYSSETATFGDRLSAAREQAGMTQEVLAKRLGVRLDTLRSWEYDRSEPRANRLSILAGLLSVSMMWLINGDGPGIDGPVGQDDGNPADANMADLLEEVRGIRVDMLLQAENMSRLERKLLKMMHKIDD